MKRKLMLFLTCLFMSVGLATAQTQTITGTVISDEDGQPVVGASVLVKGTTVGTITDTDGNFTLLNVPSSANTVQVSFIGMQSHELTIRPKMRVILKADTQLIDEVIVVAYGTAKKSAFTGSASTVKADEISKIQTSNVINALSGKTAGVQLNNASGQPGTTSPTIRVRGISSINAGNAPLIVLDGVPFSGDMNDINPNDVESMTVLKDAASNALYGARGANGVIIITTKKGNMGKSEIVVDAKWGSNSRATQDYKRIKSPAQYYEMHYSALKNYFINKLGNTEAESHALANSNLTAKNDYGLAYNVYNIPVGQDMIGTNGKLNPNATMGNLVTYNGQEYMLMADDWLDATYKNSLRQEYNITATAGSDKSSFYLSANYLKNEGIVSNSDYERFSGRLKADYQVKPWAKFFSNMAYSHYEANSLGSDGSTGSSGNVFAIATRIAPIYPLYIRDGQGNIQHDKNDFKMYDYGDGGNAGLTRPYLNNSNALSSSMLDTNYSEGNTFSATGGVEIRFLKDFKFSSTNTVDASEGRSTDVTNPYYGQYASSNGIVYKVHARRLSYNFQQLLNYTKTIDLHNISAMVGHEAYRYKYYYLTADKSNMFDPNNIELAGAITNGSMDSYTTDYNTEGYFFRGMYDYNEKYFSSISFRRDASSRFHPDNRWGNFWSAGLAWNMSKEQWFNCSWVDMLKLKASYGSQGNDDIGNYRYVNTYTIVNSSGSPAAVPNTLGNKDITWETNANLNVGIDFELFNNRLGGGVEFFYRKTTDMLFSFPLPPSFGYTSYFANIGDMRNRGVELELFTTPIKTRDFTWKVDFNLTHYKNKITYLPEERKTLVTPDGGNGFSSGNFFYGEGISIYTYYTRKFAGLNENGESLFYEAKKDAEGNYTGEMGTTTNYSDATNLLCGSVLPDVYGGFSTSLEFKGIDFSISFNYQLGGKVYDSDYAASMGSPVASSKGSSFHADLLNSWSSENTNSNIPRFQFGDTYSNANSDRFLISASYLSLQNINAGYSFPTRTCRTMGVEKLRLYIACDNVWLWSKRQGLDPRQSITGSSTASYYAPIRTISGGITLSF